MPEFAIDDQTCRQLHESQIVRSLLLPPYQQSPEPIEPTVTDLHHPSPWRVPCRIARCGQRLCPTRLRRNMRHIPVPHCRLPARHRRIPPIQAEMTRLPLLPRALSIRRRSLRDQLCSQQIAQLLHVRPVRSRQHHCQWDSSALGQQMPLATALPSVGRVRSRRFRLTGPPFFPSGALTIHPSAACHCQSSPISSS